MHDHVFRPTPWGFFEHVCASDLLISSRAGLYNRLSFLHFRMGPICAVFSHSARQSEVGWEGFFFVSIVVFGLLRILSLANSACRPFKNRYSYLTCVRRQRVCQRVNTILIIRCGVDLMDDLGKFVFFLTYNIWCLSRNFTIRPMRKNRTFLSKFPLRGFLVKRHTRKVRRNVMFLLAKGKGGVFVRASKNQREVILLVRQVIRCIVEAA